MADLTWGLTVLSLVGVVLNIYKKQVCFYIWAGTNATWAIVDYHAGLFSQAAR